MNPGLCLANPTKARLCVKSVQRGGSQAKHPTAIHFNHGDTPTVVIPDAPDTGTTSLERGGYRRGSRHDYGGSHAEDENLARHASAVSFQSRARVTRRR